MTDEQLLDRFQARLLADPVLGVWARSAIPFIRRHRDKDLVHGLDSLSAHWGAVRKEQSCPSTRES